jgi:signal transduction histidine kinase
LSLSHIEHSGADPKPAAPLDIRPVVAEVVELWRDRAASIPVGLEVDLASDLPSCTISAEDLRTIMTNLVGNAVKYNRIEGKVMINAERTATGIEIAVKDTGVGIDPENLTRLGEEFFREKRRQTRNVEGNGLGLAIVKRLIERAGGRMQIFSTVGVGSEFRVILPG